MGMQSLQRQLRRRYYRWRLAEGAMADYLAADFPGGSRPCKQTEIVAVDLETTGLDPQRDRILSIGVVPVHAMAIDLGRAWQAIIRVRDEIPEASVTIHRITDDVAAGGAGLDTVLPQLLAQLSGKVMLAHHAAIETGFLNQACRQLYGVPLLIPVIDTEHLARRRMLRRNQPIAPGDLRLFNLRARYHLPRYRAHNALSDALATAELFLALTAEMAPAGDCRLRDLLTQ